MLPGVTTLSEPLTRALGPRTAKALEAAFGIRTVGDRDDDLSGYHPMERPVASVCDVCGKRPGFGNNVSHSHRRTPRRWNPNIQRIRAKVDGSPRRLYVCTSCIKAGKVER